MQVARRNASSPRFGRLLPRGLLLGAMLALAACLGGRGGPVPYEPTGFGAPDAEGQPVAAVTQPIGALDMLQIDVFQVATLTGDFQVDSSGAIAYPLLGRVVVQGRTTQQLSDFLAARLSENYLQKPDVRVTIKQRAEQTITVDGSVRQPGVFTIKGPTTLLQAVALARGTSEDANISRVIVFRTIKGERLAGAFDLKQIRRAQAEDPTIYGNDIVVVDGSRARTLFRDLIQSMPLLGVLRPFY